MATQKRLRPLLLRMQAVLVARRAVGRAFPPMAAAVLDVRLRVIGAWIIAEMGRVEGRETA
jgi:hypothetical protein